MLQHRNYIVSGKASEGRADYRGVLILPAILLMSFGGAKYLTAKSAVPDCAAVTSAIVARTALDSEVQACEDRRTGPIYFVLGGAAVLCVLVPPGRKIREDL